MAEGGVRDLLVKLSLDTSNFTQGQTVLKSGIATLKTELKTLEQDGNIEDQAEKVKSNLTEQIGLVREQITLYEAEILKMNAALEGAEGDSKKESYLVKQLDSAKQHLSNSQAYLQSLEEKMKTFDAGKFAETMQQWSSFFSSLDSAYNGLIGSWAQETSDSAYDIAASREKALKEMYKIAGDDAGLEWLQETEANVQRAILEIPVTYEHFMQVMADAMQAGGQAYQDAYAFAETFTKLESAAPSLGGGEGVASFSRYLTLMDVTSAEYEKIASVVVELGNNFAVTEDILVSTANRAASGLKAAGFDAVDGLAIVTAALASGMNEAASATSLEKLTGNMAKGADMALNGYDDLIAKLQEVDAAYTSAEAFKIASDIDSRKRKDMISYLGIAGDDLDRMIKNARTAEKFAATMNMTVQEYGAWYQSDPAAAMVAFFGQLGQMNAEGSESILTYLDYLGITEIRASRLAKNFALTNEQAVRAVEYARDAAAEGTALEREYTQMADAEVSNQVRRQNATENALQAMGDTVTAMRQPFQDFFAEVKQGFADMPDWVQTGVAGTIEVLGGIGNVIGAVGDVSSSLYYTGQVVKEAKNINWAGIGAGLKTAGKTVGKIALPVALIAGFVELAQFTSDLAANTEAISQGLANIQIHVDEHSKEQAIASIEEVRRAAERLSTPELDTQYAQTSNIVKMGFGTTNMFATALGYEMAKSEKELEKIYMEFGAQLTELEDQVLNESDEKERQLIQGRIQATGDAMNATVQEERKRYQQSMNDLVSGALSQQEGAADQLAAIGRKYNYLDLLMQGASAEGGAQGDKDFVNKYREQLLAIYQETGVNYVNAQRNLDFAGAVKQMYGQLAQDVEAFVAANPELGNLFSTLFSSGALNDMDLATIEGEMLAAFQALDILQIGQQGAKDWRDIGRQSMAGLGNGVTTSGGEVLSAVEAVGQGMINAIKSVLQIHSPSVVMTGVGGMAVQGLANGVLAKQNVAVAAIRQVGEAMQREAALQAAKVAAILALAGYGPAAGTAVAAVSNAASSAVQAAGTVTNIFNIGAGSLAEQQNVMRLSQKIEKIAQKTNAGLGLMRG